MKLESNWIDEIAPLSRQTIIAIAYHNRNAISVPKMSANADTPCPFSPPEKRWKKGHANPVCPVRLPAPEMET